MFYAREKCSAWHITPNPLFILIELNSCLSFGTLNLGKKKKKGLTEGYMNYEMSGLAVLKERNVNISY